MILPFLRRGPTYAYPVTPGSVAFTSAGTYVFVVPRFHSLTVDVRAGGGGGGGLDGTSAGLSPGSDGGNGGVSYFANSSFAVYCENGYGGTKVNAFSPTTAPNGVDGGASGGDSNIPAGGSLGGLGSNRATGHGNAIAGHGGAGGRAVRSFTKGGLLVPFTSITVVVGGGGLAGSYDPAFSSQNQFPQNGATGAVFIAWS